MTNAEREGMTQKINELPIADAIFIGSGNYHHHKKSHGEVNSIVTDLPRSKQTQLRKGKRQ